MAYDILHFIRIIDETRAPSGWAKGWRDSFRVHWSRDCSAADPRRRWQCPGWVWRRHFALAESPCGIRCNSNSSSSTRGDSQCCATWQCSRRTAATGADAASEEERETAVHQLDCNQTDYTCMLYIYISYLEIKAAAACGLQHTCACDVHQAEQLLQLHPSCAWWGARRVRSQPATAASPLQQIPHAAHPQHFHRVQWQCRRHYL